MSDLTDIIGVVRSHRWGSVDIQTERLKADGCKRIINLSKGDREQLVMMVRERTLIKVVWAILLVAPGKSGVKRMFDSYQAFSKRLAKLPRGCHGYVKDVDSGIVADTKAGMRAMELLVRDQIRRDLQGRKSADNLPREKEFSEIEWLKAENAFHNPTKYPTVERLQAYYDEEIPGFTYWRANREWGKRPRK